MADSNTGTLWCSMTEIFIRNFRAQKVTPEATQNIINETTTVQSLPSMTSDQSPRFSYANAVKSAPKSSPPKEVQKKLSTIVHVPSKKQPMTEDKQER